MVVKRYLRPGDVYVHADLRGAASVVIRNKNVNNEIPPKTLIEAAQLAICYSGAWDSKVISNAWWVHHDQVTRTAPTGEYLPSGSFMIRGKKNFLPPSQLVLGFALLFKLDEDSIKHHEGERNQFNNGEEETPKQEDDENEDEICREEEDGAEAEENEEEEEEMQFPDVNVPINTLNLADTQEEYSILEIGAKANRPAQIVPPETRKYLEDKHQVEDLTTKLKREQAAAARQKKKQKLIKKKYADQDEEEREQRMQILGSRGQPKNVPEKKEEQPVVEQKPRKETKRDPMRKNPSQEGGDEGVTDENVVMLDDAVEENVQTLTGRPLEEDTLLFALPVVAPYNTLTTYKYKVKLTPGTGKRGKAVKSALELFMRTTAAAPREVALMKALIGDDSASRNVPGKVKVSAPQLHAK
ncbi:unnamed protein product, partial [Mesorhabditis belari]|uniref:Uncharacterized protein n=1 Tax=Mesorhabditis belari TaxID=2138241 RepID=A0AAF3J6R9_9BILA